ncbi:MAG: radical SAM protein [Verrucomicrobia bacterium]|nr:radical SAM protein [Verrucomicrobiota bacterium]
MEQSPDDWILGKRPARNPLDPNRPYASLVEKERSASGTIVPVATLFLTNRECPWRCVYCDLWKNTLEETLPAGAIPNQIDFALKDPALRNARHIKLYNSGSFFDPNAIPPGDHPAIADRVQSFERVIVESHPALVGESAVRFRDRINTKLEVAMGLETVHPGVLPRLNKRMTLDLFARAARFLRDHEIALRVFILVKPPFLNDESEALHWAKRSIQFAFEQAASVVSLIPTRSGNGVMESLTDGGEFAPPRLETLEAAVEYGVALQRGRVFADLWDLDQFADCTHCFSERRDRLNQINFSQELPGNIRCAVCGTANSALVQ